MWDERQMSPPVRAGITAAATAVFSVDERTTPSRGTVLIADDDLALCQSVIDILSLAGYHVLWANDGDETLRQVISHRVDVLVLDMHMPKREGLSVLDALGRPRPMVIVCSGFVHFSARDIDRLGLGRRVFRLLRKPVPPVELLSAVGDAINQLHLDANDDFHYSHQ